VQQLMKAPETTDATLIGPVSRIPVGEGRVFAVAGRKVAVFRTHAGEIFAAQAACPHAGGPLADGLLGGSTVVCPLHDRAYDLRTGAGLNGEPATIEVYPVSLDDAGNVWLALTR
jgi:nitrite reductase (NADH) small subunit